MAIKRFLLSLFLIPIGLFCYGDQVQSTSFKGLNNNDSSFVIDPSQAQDLLNVDVTPGGKTIKKRSGYGLYKALSTGQAMHGGYHAYDSSGNDYQLWGSSTSLYGIVSDGTPTQLVSSSTLNATWDCADTQGNSYCVDSSRDAYIKTNGATETWYTSPLGTMVESTPDRIVISGVSGTPNTLYFSGSNDFTNFTTDVKTTDPFTEVIAAPGSHITHIRWGCGKLLWWKDNSFGYVDFDDQYNLQIKTVSDIVGTIDNTSAIDPGANVWFRGQDGHTWRYDCSALEKMSIPITPEVQVSGNRTSNSWTQTTQSDFQSGAGNPSANFSYTISPGDVVLSSYSHTDTSASDFASGTFTNTYVSGNSVIVSTSNTDVTNNGFETGDLTGWNHGGVGTVESGTSVLDSCNVTSRTGTYRLSDISVLNLTAGWDMQAQLLKCSDNSELSRTHFFHANNSCTWTQRTISGSGLARQCAYLKLRNVTDGVDIILSDNFILSGNDVTFYSASDSFSPYYFMYFDDFTNGKSSITVASYKSQVFDSSISSTVAQIQATISNGNPVPYFEMLTSSASTGPWSTVATSTNTNASSLRYFQYISTITQSGNSGMTTSIDDVSVVAVSSGGTYLSAVKNAPNLTAWNTIGINSASYGGTHTFYMRSSTNSFTVSSGTPSWTSQTAGGLISVSTGTYFQLRDDFAAASSTASMALNDFTINWFEGTTTDQSYMLYFDNAIWQSVAFGTGQSTNNYIFKYDLINDGWTLYNFGAGGLMTQRNQLYFGDTSSGNVYIYGTASSDNGSSINAYWKTKDFSGNDPFLVSQLTNIDTFFKADNGTTMTNTYNTDGLNSTSYSVSLSTGGTFIQNRKILPSGKLGYSFSLKTGDDSTSSQWEFLGFRIGLNQLPYRPSQ